MASSQPVSRKKGGKETKQERSHLRKSKGHQCTNHHHKVQDVPEVSEVGPILQDQALVYHLQNKGVNNH